MGFTVRFYCCQRRPYWSDHRRPYWRYVTKKKGKLWHLINISRVNTFGSSTYIFFSVTPLYSSGGHSNMAAVGFSFPTMDARSSPIFQISGRVNGKQITMKINTCMLFGLVFLHCRSSRRKHHNTSFGPRKDKTWTIFVKDCGKGNEIRKITKHFTFISILVDL